MFRRTRAALGMVIATQLLSGCCWCHRPFFCCGQRYFAPYEPCTTCYQPAVSSAPMATPVYMGAPIQGAIPMLKSAPANPAQTAPGSTTPPGTIPSFPASARR